MDLQLARVRSGQPDGCDVVYLDGDVTEHVAFGPAVVDQIRVRRNDLVAVDVAVTPPAIVWRWWHGVVDSIDSDRRVAECHRPAGNEGGTAAVSVHVPDELRNAVRPAASIWFGREDDDSLVAIAAGGERGAARARLAGVREAYLGG